MQRREKVLLARDTKRNIGKELLQAVRDVKAGKGRRIDANELARARTRSSRR
jgi:putative transcriptional regulator